MHEDERRAAISKLIEAYTAKYAADARTARKALIRSGIYTKKGKLRTKFDSDKVKDAKAG